ncbi:MAG: aminotransferase class I/II-fold pyridoxal phosphate-dependent enzyme, partial [Planctomycetaceae bacterium]|nr:aminotransferase class I/II-fold pyridoxal phosphate-dependent enzyme [Planctomycetaceae bacterium]
MIEAEKDMLQSRQASYSNSRLWFWVVALLLPFGLVRIFLSPSPLLGADWSCWLAYAQDMKTTVFHDQRYCWNLYFPKIQGGSVGSTIYSAPVIVPWLLTLFFSATTAIKICLLISVGTVFLSVYAFLRELANRATSSLVALSVTLYLLKLINHGMWYNAVSIALALLFARTVFHFSLRKRSEGVYWFFSIALLTIIACCHPLGVFIAAVFWLVMLVEIMRKERFSPKRVIAFLSIPFIAFCFSFPQTGSLLIEGGGAANSNSIAPPGILSIINPNRFLAGINLLYWSFFILFGLTILFMKHEKKVLFFGLFFVLLFFLVWFSRLFLVLYPYLPMVDLMVHFAGRTSYVIKTMLFILAVLFLQFYGGIFLQKFIFKQNFQKQNLRSRFDAMWDVSKKCLTGLCLLILLTLYWCALKGTLDNGSDYQDYLAVEAYLKERVLPENERIYFENEDSAIKYPMLGESNGGISNRINAEWNDGLGTNLFAALRDKNDFYQFGESWRGPNNKVCYLSDETFLGIQLEDVDGCNLKERLARFNCRYVVTYSESLRNMLRAYDFFDEKECGRFSVFSVNGFVSSWSFADGDVAKPLYCTLDSSCRFTVHDVASRPEAQSAIVSFFYASGWTAKSNGRSLNVSSWNGLIQVDIPPGVPVNNICLEYNVSRLPGLVGFGTGLALLPICWFLLYRRNGIAKMSIPFNFPYYTGRELESMQAAMATGQLHGDCGFTKKCHSLLESRYGCKKAFLTHSGTGALEMSALLLDIEPGDEFIVPSYTFVSTANAFVLRGGVPVWCDIRSDTLNMDESKIEALITPKTRAIVPVHYAGVACEMDAILGIAKKHKLFVVEDAAQGVEAFYRDKPLGTLGHFGCYSFHNTKNYSC